VSLIPPRLAASPRLECLRMRRCPYRHSSGRASDGVPSGRSRRPGVSSARAAVRPAGISEPDLRPGCGRRWGVLGLSACCLELLVASRSTCKEHAATPGWLAASWCDDQAQLTGRAGGGRHDRPGRGGSSSQQQCRARVCSAVPLKKLPTAQMLLADVAPMPARELPLPGFGVFTCSQTEPFQCKTRVRRALPLT
jgi:hypothetical protein